MTAKDRFLKYVRVYSTSDDSSPTSPSTERQKDMGRLLMEEMRELGLEDIRMDDSGNTIGTLPASKGFSAPVIALIAHVDTTPDAPGENVHPQVVIYTGSPIRLNAGIELNERLCPGLADYRDREIICTDGLTLLGGDDKAGVAECMAAVELMISQGRPHGEVRLVFTTDEEVGRGVEGLDVDNLGCDFGYTVDGGELGELQFENFNAASATVTLYGTGAHPGTAKGIMVNASKLAMEFNACLPTKQCPECTEGYQGFFHLHCMSGSMTQSGLTYLIRDHDAAEFDRRKQQLYDAQSLINAKYGANTCTVEIRDSYRNMREMVEPRMEIVEKAKAAFLANGIEPIVRPIRGGTDGANLSWKGLPCPNLSTGGFNAHSVREWVPSDALHTMTNVLCDLITSYAEPDHSDVR